MHKNIILLKHLSLQKTIQVSNLLASKESVFEGQSPANQSILLIYNYFLKISRKGEKQKSICVLNRNQNHNNNKTSKNSSIPMNCR